MASQPFGLPSPAPSSSSSDLPHPRTRSLASGSDKEDMVRRFADAKLSSISRRYVKKFAVSNPEDATDAVVGFQDFGQVADELDSVVNVLWKSGTPTLQIPILLKLASDFTQYVRSFPPAPRATFRLLRKLDHCFASLILGRDVDTDEPLPGFDGGVVMTVTDMVRCRSLVEQSRFLVVEIMSTHDDDDDEEEEDDDEDDEDGSEDDIHLDAARVYERAIVQLETRLGGVL